MVAYRERDERSGEREGSRLNDWSERRRKDGWMDGWRKRAREADKVRVKSLLQPTRVQFTSRNDVWSLRGKRGTYFTIWKVRLTTFDAPDVSKINFLSPMVASFGKCRWDCGWKWEPGIGERESWNDKWGEIRPLSKSATLTRCQALHSNRSHLSNMKRWRIPSICGCILKLEPIGSRCNTFWKLCPPWHNSFLEFVNPHLTSYC